jgi:hypothetical protein
MELYLKDSNKKTPVQAKDNKKVTPVAKKNQKKKGTVQEEEKKDEEKREWIKTSFWATDNTPLAKD